METLGIPEFSEKDPMHKELARLSIKAHKRVEKNKETVNIENQIETLVRKLWNIKS